MKGTIRFSAEEFHTCIRRLDQIRELILDHKEEYAAICSDDLSDMPEEVLKELLAVKESYRMITEALSADIEKMRRIAEVYEFCENKNFEMVSALPQKAGGIHLESALSYNKRLILQWDGAVRSGRLIRSHILMDDWLYEHIAGYILSTSL